MANCFFKACETQEEAEEEEVNRLGTARVGIYDEVGFLQRTYIQPSAFT